MSIHQLQPLAETAVMAEGKAMLKEEVKERAKVRAKVKEEEKEKGSLKMALEQGVVIRMEG